MSLVNSTKDFTRTKRKMNQNMNWVMMVTTAALDVHNNNTEEPAGNPEITTEELQTAINKLKKRQIPRQQRNPSRRR